MRLVNLNITLCTHLNCFGHTTSREKLQADATELPPASVESGVGRTSVAAKSGLGRPITKPAVEFSVQGPCLRLKSCVLGDARLPKANRRKAGAGISTPRPKVESLVYTKLVYRYQSSVSNLVIFTNSQVGIGTRVVRIRTRKSGCQQRSNLSDCLRISAENDRRRSSIFTRNGNVRVVNGRRRARDFIMRRFRAGGRRCSPAIFCAMEKCT